MDLDPTLPRRYRLFVTTLPVPRVEALLSKIDSVPFAVADGHHSSTIGSTRLDFWPSATANGTEYDH